MKLTELKKKIDEALKIHDDYDVKIITEDDFDRCIDEPDDCGVDPGRFIFYIHVDVSIIREECDKYHIDDDDSMELCSVCDIYHSDKIECPKCWSIRMKKKIKELTLMKE